MLSKRVFHHPFVAPACICLLTILTASSINAASVRGASPHLLSHYDTKVETFRCLDGSKSIHRSRVNDDYCDCLDGSDEPGTSACSNGQFYCRNRGHQPLLLNASFVDDGTCDCCDGTDETKGCKNTCRAAGSVARQDLISKSKEYAAGAKTRQKYISQSQASKAQWKLELVRVQKDIAVQQSITDQAKAAKEKAEEADRQRREAEAALKKEDEAKDSAAAPDSALKPEDTVNTGSQTVVQGEEGGEDPLAATIAVEDTADEGSLGQKEDTRDTPIKAEETVDTDSQHVLKGEEGSDEDPLAATTAVQDTADETSHKQKGGTRDSPIKAEDTVDTGSQHVLKEAADKEEERELTPDEIGRKIASQWTTDPDAAGSGDSSDVEETMLEEDEEHTGSGAEEADDVGTLRGKVAESASAGAKASIPDGFSVEAISARAAAYWDMSKDWINEKVGSKVLGAKSSLGKGTLSGDLTSARDTFAKADGRLQELKSQQTDLESKLGNDYGLEEALGALVDKCFEAQVDKYTYSVCPFKDAFQKEGSSRTSLGTWAGLADNSTVMKFSGGQGCWQGPARSMTVLLKCGSSENLMRVEEPSRCEYTATLATPAACNPAEAQAVQDQLAALNKELEGDHSEL